MPKNRKKRNKVRQTPAVQKIANIPDKYLEVIGVGQVLFPALYQFENALRIALHSFLVECYGQDWWLASLKVRREKIFEYAENQQKKLDAMPWIGSSAAVEILPVHLVTLGQLEDIVKAYASDCVPELFPTLDFFTGHMEIIKRVRNMYSHMFPCISKSDCEFATNEIRVLVSHLNCRLPK